MSQASSEFDDLDASGELESDIFGASDLSASDDFGSEVGFEPVESSADFGSEVGFEEASTDDLMQAGGQMDAGGFEDAAAVAAAPMMYKKQGFSIYTLMLVLSFLALTATAIIMFTYAASL
jgi:hypothetical protein